MGCCAALEDVSFGVRTLMSSLLLVIVSNTGPPTDDWRWQMNSSFSLDVVPSFGVPSIGIPDHWSGQSVAPVELVKKLFDNKECCCDMWHVSFPSGMQCQLQLHQWNQEQHPWNQPQAGIPVSFQTMLQPHWILKDGQDHLLA